MGIPTLVVWGGAFVIAIGLIWMVAAMALEHWMVRWDRPPDRASNAEGFGSDGPLTPPREQMEWRTLRR
jgi:hypothetical protein